jgi:four helix bundle protein
MSRNFRNLRMFVDSDALVLDVYRATAALPPEERYGLQAQIRRSSVSVPCNIVEGSSRRTTSDYCRFLEIAGGSARECGYLIGLTGRLEFLPHDFALALSDRYEAVHAGLTSAIHSLEPGRRGR